MTRLIQKKQSTIFLKVGLVVLVCLAVVVGGTNLISIGLARSAIPAEIKLGRSIYSNNVNDDPFQICGVHIFKLRRSTLRKLDEDGLEFLMSATQSRSGGEDAIDYGRWQLTPRRDWGNPEDWIHELRCADISKDLEFKIVDEGLSKKAYYTFGPNRALMILPESKVLVYTHN